MKRIVYLFAVLLIMATVEAQTLTERQKGLAACACLMAQGDMERLETAVRQAYTPQAGAGTDLRRRSRLVSGVGQGPCRDDSRHRYRHPCRGKALARCTERLMVPASYLS